MQGTKRAAVGNLYLALELMTMNNEPPDLRM
jgi:hypothetical protein